MIHLSNSSFSDINKNVWINTKEEEKKYKLNAWKLDIQAKVSLIALSIIPIAAVTLAVAFIPGFTPFAFIIGGSTIKYFYFKFYLPYQNKSAKYNELAKHLLGISNKIKKYEEKNLKGSDFYEKLNRLKVLTKEIKNKDVLERIDPKKDTYHSLANLIGRVKYWSKFSKEVEAKIKKLDEKIKKNHSLIKNQKTDSKTRSKQLILNMKRHQLEEEEFIPSKLAAAFNLHIICNIKDMRPIESFGSLEPSSYIEAMTWKTPADQPYYFFPMEDSRQPLSKQWLKDSSIQKIAKKVFCTSALTLA